MGRKGRYHRDGGGRRTGPVREVLYGRQPVLECLRAGLRQAFILHAGRRTGMDAPVMAEISALAGRRGLEIRFVEETVLDDMTGAGNHQGIAVEVSPYVYAELAGLEASAARGFCVALDHVQDPQNLGAILRTCEAAGAGGVIIPKDRSSGVTPAAVRASAGASEHLRVARVINLVRALRGLKEAGYQVIGLEHAPEAVPLAVADFTFPACLVVGSEAKGLGRLVREACDLLVMIPLYGKVTSLNASAAAALAIYEMRRRISPETAGS